MRSFFFLFAFALSSVACAPTSADAATQQAEIDLRCDSVRTDFLEHAGTSDRYVVEGCTHQAIYTCAFSNDQKKWLCTGQINR